MPHVEWVFDCDAPLDEFQQRMREALMKRGWIVSTAQVHDFAAARAGQRAYVKLTYHDWGVQVRAKLKPGWFGSDAQLQQVVWAAGREAQLGVLGWKPPTPPGPDTY